MRSLCQKRRLSSAPLLCLCRDWLDDDLDDAEGVWGHILSLVPRSEVFEVEALVGSSLIADNAALWRELKAFSSILTELHTLEFDEPLGMTPRETRLTAANLGQLEGAAAVVPTLQLPPPNEQHEGPPTSARESNNGGALTKRSTGSTGDSMEAIYAIQDKLGVDKIHHVLEDIRRALRSEKAELEAEIALLMNAMDSETDNVAAKQAKQQGALAVESSSSSVCASCARFHDFAAQQPGRIAHRKSAAAASSRGLCFSCLEKEHQMRKLQQAAGSDGGGEGGGGKQSRLRTRLQNAVDEKYFV